MTKIKNQLENVANLLIQPQLWYGLFGASVCLLLMATAAGLARRHRLATLPTTSGQADSSQAEVMLQASWPIQADTHTLEWRRLLATAEADLADGDYLIFTVSGEQVPTLGHDQDYYVVDRIAYENFAPKSLDDLILLQLPESTLKPVSDNGAFVELAAPWKVPADIPGEISYQVDSWNGFAVPAGEFVVNTATVWLLPAQTPGVETQTPAEPNSPRQTAQNMV